MCQSPLQECIKILFSGQDLHICFQDVWNLVTVQEFELDFICMGAFLNNIISHKRVTSFSTNLWSILFASEHWKAWASWSGNWLPTGYFALALQLKCALNKKYEPDFSKAIQHFLLHTGGRGVIDELETNLKLTPEQAQPAKDTLFRFGNTSAASTWYILAGIETHSGVKKGDRVWQLGRPIHRFMHDLSSFLEASTKVKGPLCATSENGKILYVHTACQTWCWDVF